MVHRKRRTDPHQFSCLRPCVQYPVVIRNQNNNTCEGIKVWFKLRCSIAPTPPAENLFQNLTLPWWTSSRIYLFPVYIQLLDTFLCLLILKAPPSPVFTPSYNNREQSHPLSLFSAKELRSGSDTGVTATHHSVVNEDPVHLHSLIAFTVDRVNRYFHPIKF